MECEWKSKFARSFLKLQSENEVFLAFKLIRCHEHRLTSQGDFSCPAKLEIWSNVLEKLDLEMSTNLPMIKKYEEKNGFMTFWLDRKTFIEDFFRSIENIDFGERSELTVNIFNRQSSKCQLTSIRCHQVFKFVQNLLKCQLVNYEANEVVISNNDKIANCIKVGPVISRDSKKKSTESFLDQYKRLYRVLDDASKERLVQSETKRIANVHSLVCAEMQFQMLNNNIGQPSIVDEKCEKSATFVLYNHARIVQLMQSASEVRKEEVDFSLLKEEDEWEIIYVYLSRYVNVLNEVMRSNDVKVGRLIHFLIGLSQSFSRYYNRVHVIKENAPHLQSTQSTRLYLISTIRRVLEHALHLLDIPCLGKM